MRKFSFLVITASLLFTSCRELGGRRVRGNGHVTTQTRSVTDFDGIYVGGAINVYVKQDSVLSVKVIVDDNLQEFIEVHNEGSTLEIHPANHTNIRSSDKVKVYVSGPTFKSFEVSGASDIYGETPITSNDVLKISASGASGARLDIDAPKIDVDLNGASHVDLRGKTRDLDASASGASKIRAYELLSENTNIDFSGASHGDVFASVKLSGHASGASNVNYKGNASTDISTSGASGIKKVQ